MNIVGFHNSSFYINNISKAQNRFRTNTVSNNITPLKHDTVSFGAMKKTQFKGIDFAVIEKFKAPIEKFHSNEDLQAWSENKIEKILQNNFQGRNDETTEKREEILDEWKNYLFNKDNNISNTKKLLVIDSITNDLRHDNEKLPSKFNEQILNDSFEEIDSSLLKDKKYQFNFNKIYTSKLKNMFLEPEQKTPTSWIIIPSKTNDSENFESNVEKLRSFSSPHWCTKGHSAYYYLQENDYHIFLENGQARLGIKLQDGKIEEIQSEDNSNIIPLNYIPIMEEHIQEGKYKISMSARPTYDKLISVKIKTDKIKKKLASAIKNNDAKAILNYFGIKCTKNEDGMLIVPEYRQPDKYYSFSDLGIDENKLLEQIIH